MFKSKQHFMAFCLIVFVSCIFFTCSHKQPIDNKEAEAELWEMQLRGEVVGKLKLMLVRIRIENDVYTIAGKMSGKLKDFRAGMGTVDFKFEGKIENDIFKVNFSGSSNMEAGPSPISGRINGTVSESQGSGRYSVLHAFGSSHGYYTMKKIHSN